MSHLTPPPPMPPSPQPWPPSLTVPRTRQWPMSAFLIVALLVTLAVAIIGWFRPVPAKQPPPPTYSSQQVADAKTAICAAYQQVRKAGDLAGARSGIVTR